MSLRFELAGREYVLGLEWDVIHSDRPQADEIRDLVNRHDSQYGVKLKTPKSGAIHVGFTKNEKADAKLPSAAAHLALVVPNVVLVEQLDEHRYWYVVVVDGVVYPGTDRVGSLESIIDALTDALDDMGLSPESASSMKFCAPGLTRTEAFQGFTLEDFAALINNDEEKSFRLAGSTLSQAQIRRISAPVDRRIVVVGAAVVFAVLYLLFSGEEAIDAEPVKSIEQLRAEGLIPAAPTEPPKPSKEQRAELLLKGSAEFVALQLGGGEPHILLPRARQLVKDFWPGVGGWSFKHMEVTHGGPASINLDAGGGTIGDAFSKIDGEEYIVEFSSDGSTLTVKSEASVGEKHDVETVFENLKTTRGHAVQLASTFQRWSLGWSMEKREVSGSAASSADGEGGVDLLGKVAEKLGLAQDEKAPFAAYSFEVKSDFYMLPKLAEMFSAYPTLTITRVQFGDAPKTAIEQGLNFQDSSNARPQLKGGDLTIKGVLYEAR